MPIIGNFFVPDIAGSNTPQCQTANLDFDVTTVGGSLYAADKSTPDSNTYVFNVSERYINTKDNVQGVYMRLFSERNSVGLRQNMIQVNGVNYTGEATAPAPPPTPELEGIWVPIGDIDDTTSMNSGTAVSVTSEDGGTTKQYTFKVYRMSSDAGLERICIGETTEIEGRPVYADGTHQKLLKRMDMNGILRTVYEVGVPVTIVPGQPWIEIEASNSMSMVWAPYDELNISDPDQASGDEYYVWYGEFLDGLPNLAEVTGTDDQYNALDHLYFHIVAEDGTVEYYVLDIYQADRENRNLADVNGKPSVWVFPTGSAQPAVPNVTVSAEGQYNAETDSWTPTVLTADVKNGTTSLTIAAQTEYGRATVGVFLASENPQADRYAEHNAVYNDTSAASGRTYTIYVRSEAEGFGAGIGRPYTLQINWVP